MAEVQPAVMSRRRIALQAALALVPADALDATGRRLFARAILTGDAFHADLMGWLSSQARYLDAYATLDYARVVEEKQGARVEPPAWFSEMEG